MGFTAAFTNLKQDLQNFSLTKPSQIHSFLPKKSQELGELNILQTYMISRF